MYLICEICTWSCLFEAEVYWGKHPKDCRPYVYIKVVKFFYTFYIKYIFEIADFYSIFNEYSVSIVASHEVCTPRDLETNDQILKTTHDALRL